MSDPFPGFRVFPRLRSSANEISADQVVEAAEDLAQPVFSQGDLARELGVKTPEMRLGFRVARRAGLLEKVRDDDEGIGLFRLANGLTQAG